MSLKHRKKLIRILKLVRNFNNFEKVHLKSAFKKYSIQRMPSTRNKNDYFDNYIKCVKLILLDPTIFKDVFVLSRFSNILLSINYVHV